MVQLLPATCFLSPVLVIVLVLIPRYPASGTNNGMQTAPPPRCESASESFVTWARKNAVPVSLASDVSKQPYLERLQKATVDARIVAIGEAQRRVEEFYQFRSRLFRSLVMNGGFTALAMETGFVEAMQLNDYVTGRGPEPTDWQKWFTNGYGDEAALQSDLRWIRAYNREPTHMRKIHFYGIDLMVPYSSPLTALTATFDYLDRVDTSFALAPTRKALLLTVQDFLGSGDSRANLAVHSDGTRRFPSRSATHTRRIWPTSSRGSMPTALTMSHGPPKWRSRGLATLHSWPDNLITRTA